jgi:hypothetical protein
VSQALDQRLDDDRLVSEFRYLGSAIGIEKDQFERSEGVEVTTDLCLIAIEALGEVGDRVD